MKKIVLFLIMFSTAIFLFSCGNAGVYRQFNTKFEMFKLKVSSTNQIVMDMNIEVELFESSKPLGKNGFEATIKMNESPLYIDVSAGEGSNKESYVLSQKGNDLYQHEIVNENLVITEFYSSVDEYENDEYDIAFGFKFDKENGEAKKENDYFIFTQKYGEALTKADKEYLKEMYEMLDLSIDDMLESTMVTKLKFDKEKMYMSFDLDTEMNYNNQKIQVKSKIEYDIKIEEFELYDLDNMEHIISNIDNVYNYSKLNHFYNNDETSIRYYKYNLDKGLYYFDSPDNTNDFKFYLFDSNKKEIEVAKMFDNISNETKYGTIFEIKESGDYYIQVRNCNSLFSLKSLDNNDIKKLDYKTNENITFNLKENEFAYINNFKPKTGFICIENSGNYDIIIESLYDGSRSVIIPNKKCYMDSFHGEKGLVFTTQNDTECIVKISEINKSGDPSTPFGDLEIITDQPSNGFYFCGRNYKNPKIRLIVTETGYYSFFNTMDDKSSKMFFELEMIKGEQYQWQIDNTYLLFPGEYCLTMNNGYSSKAAYGNVYYEFEPCDIQSQHELEVKSGKDPNSSDFPTVHLPNNYGTELVKYYFNIEKECILYYEDNDRIYIRDEAGNYFGGLDGYCYLPAGRYYITSTRDFGSSGFTFKFGIVEQDKTNYELTLMETSSKNINVLPFIENEHFFACGLYKYWFTLTEDSIIVHDYYSCRIFDEYGNLISDKEQVVNLQAGRYYVTYYSNIVKIALYKGN